MSNNGKYIVSGEWSNNNIQAEVIVWDFENKKIHQKLSIYKNSVEQIEFSKNDEFLLTVGGFNDKNQLIIWNIKDFKYDYGLKLHQEVKDIKFFNNNPDKIIAVLNE